MLHAQSAQLDGDRDGAQRAFRAMAERADTRLLGLRGLFVEAQRADDPVAAVMIAEEALKLAPSSTWASHAVLGYRCAKGDWNGALSILDTNLSAGLIDKPTYRRQRGVLLTARALELETVDRDKSRDTVMEAVKLAPTLVPAAVLASKFESEAHQVRRSMRIIEAAWLAQPHPDLADAYAHVKLGDSARQRLVRVETLAAKAPGHIEGALAIARAAIDAAEFARAREALAPFIAAPTQRVAMLMAEIERTEHGDSGRARAWTLRAVRALHDPVWTADGYVSASLAPGIAGHRPARCVSMADAAGGTASDKAPRSNPRRSRRRCWRRNRPRRAPSRLTSELRPSRRRQRRLSRATAAQDNAPLAPSRRTAAGDFARAAAAVRIARVRQRRCSARARIFAATICPRPQDSPKPQRRHSRGDSRFYGRPTIPASTTRASRDEFAEQIGPGNAQAGGWRGFLSRWGELMRAVQGSRFSCQSRRDRYQVRAFSGGFPNVPRGSPQ